jgi:integrase
MPERHSTAPSSSGKPAKPEKPTPDFPLYAHAAGYWAKRIRGRVHYFGRWDDPNGALDNYNAQKDALHSGRKPREAIEGTTVKDLCNRFLAAKQGRVDAGELSPLSWKDYKDACDEIVAAFGKRRLLTDLGPDDFADLRKRLAAKCAPVRLGNSIQRIRSVFKYGYDVELLDRAIRFGPDFARPSRKVLRIERPRKDAKLFTADEVRRMIEAAGPQLRAMLLLAINAGMGNTDCATLPITALDLHRGFLDYPRPKTGIPRRAALWPETVAALKEALAERPTPKDEADAGLCFITKYGHRWARVVMTPTKTGYRVSQDDAVSKETRKLLDQLGIEGHRNFYALRHTFRTVADGAKDQPVADHIMGHEVAHMSSVYREGIDDARLKAVADHVHAWLFGGVETPDTEAKAE